MFPGNHLMRTTYGPGFDGSPNSTACSLVPAAFLTHLMSAGTVKSTAARSRSAAALGDAAIAKPTARANERIVLVMSPPCEWKKIAAPVYRSAEGPGLTGIVMRC